MATVLYGSVWTLHSEKNNELFYTFDVGTMYIHGDIYEEL